MKYRDLIQFDPIVTVIELRSADDAVKARELVRSYVMSDAMADLVNGKILSQLNLEEVVDNKGVLLVGNYGTGKSHLMSVISAIANDEKLLADAQNPHFRDMAKTIAGKFEVLRIEIGSTEMSLRSIMTSNIEKDLAHRGIKFRFPDVSQITNNKDALNDMMAAFGAVYGDRGYLVVVDELLDYLKGRKDNELMQDINIMRELGEFIKNSRFRFISGIQEALFDNPTFHNVSNSLLKMKDRYEQALIRSQDIAYVAKQRVLHKTPEQKAMIRERLTPFCKLYPGMAEQLEEYVELFPIHPAYINTFQRMIIVEKREVLKAISETIGEIINTEVPQNAPGIISYDSYWKRIQNDPGKRVEPAVAEVLHKSQVLEDIIQRSFQNAVYKATALKIIAALSVHRLTTVTLEAKVGLTAKNLKDELCIFPPIPQIEEGFLLTTVQSVLREIMNTVSGQFIEYNKDNEQYYLDLKKDVDYDKKIQEKADFLGDDRLNQYFYSLIWDCLDWHPEQYTSGHLIYQYNINWIEKNHFRRGYLFMGTSADRPTAQPPEDFYAYFLPPYGKPGGKMEQKEDEVYFIFQPDAKFTQLLRQFAGAREMEVLSAQGETKSAYTQRAKTTSRDILRWMDEHKTAAFKVSYCNVEKAMLEYLRGARMDTLNIKSAIDTCVSKALSVFFASSYPDFPAFRSPITQENQANVRIAAMEAIGGKPQKLGIDTLEALGLWLNGKVKPENSRYATHYIQMLGKLPDGAVLNFADVMEHTISDATTHVDKRFKLTDILSSIVFAALVYGGYCVLVADNNARYDASNIETLVKANPLDLYRFKRLEKPKAVPVLKLRRLLTALSINDALIMNDNAWETAVVELLKRSKELSELSFHFDSVLGKPSYLWGDSIIPTHQAEQYKKDLLPLRKLGDDIRSRFHSAPKLKNFDYDDDKLGAVEKAIETLDILQGVETFKAMVGDLMQYLTSAEMKVEESAPLRKAFAEQKDAYLAMRDHLLVPGYDEVQTDALLDALEALKKEYIDYYMERHAACRLGIKDAQRRQKLLNSGTVAKLRILSQLSDILPTGKFGDLVNRQLADLRVCYECTGVELQRHVECPHCGFNPAAKEPPVAGRIDFFEEKLTEMLESWKETLLGTLDDPMLRDRQRYMSTELQQIIQRFAETKRFPDDLNKFCTAVREAFADYECIEVNETAFMEEVLSWGTLSPEAFKKRMGDYIDRQVGHKNKDQVRLTFCDNKP